jgi:hypothetical protein
MVGIEPSETIRKIVDLGLLRQGKRQAELVSKLKPTALVGEGGRGLGAPMHNND